VATYQIQQLADLCAEHRLTPKIVFVPSIQAGSALGSALARAGTNWINLRFTTPEDLSREISEPGFLADGWTPLPKDADLIELAPLVKAFLEGPNNTYFQNQRFSQGLLRSIHRTVRALRIAGTPPETLLRQRGSQKLRAIAQLYVAYQDCLESKRWYDGPDLFATATTWLEQNPQTGTTYAILDETPLPGLAKRFVRTLAATGISRIGRASYGVTIPETIAASGLSDQAAISDVPCEPAGDILRRSSESVSLDTIDLRLSSGPEIEIQSALNRILSSGWPLDTVEWVCTSPDLLNYAYDATHKQGIPATFGSGISILLTRPGQAIRSALNWIASDGDPKWLESLLSGRLLNQDVSISDGIPSILAEMGALNRDSGSTPVARIATLGAQLLSDHVSTLTETEEPARDSLVSRLEQLAEHCDADGAPGEMANLLLDVVDAHRFAPGAPKPGHLNVVPLERAGFAGRPHTFVLGLDSSTFPGAPGEDPLLLDHERSRISDDLEMLRTRPIAQVWHLIRVLGLSPATSLSASTYRLADGQESEPAALFHHLEAVTTQKTYKDALLATSPETTSEIGIWKLAWARHLGNMDALAAESPWLLEGEAAEHSRVQQTFSRFKGLASSETLPVDESPVWSASRLETLTRCPYRYFWRYVLQIEAPDETRDSTRWLSPLEFGSLLHELYQRFMADAPDRDTPPDVETGTSRILELLQKLIDQTTRVLPPPNPLAFEVDEARLQTAARVFVAEESKRPNDHKPRGFEVSFGFDAEGGLNHPEPVALQFGDTTLKLRGLIDRVDETQNGYVIWDYKTGSAIPYDESDLLGGGQHLQWALYAHAFTEILKERGLKGPIQSGYYFASDREHGRKMLAIPPSREMLAGMLGPVLGLASRGAFPPVQKTPQCRFCDYKSICEKDQMLPKSVVTGPGDADAELIELATEWLSS
jgi:RecB family exonuclease